MKKIFSYFLQGLFYIAPIGLTVYIIYWSFTYVDGFIQKALQSWVHFKIPGLGIVAIFFSLALLGFLGQTFIATPIKNLFNRVIDRTPIVKVIYSALRDLFSAFTGKEKKFSKPVLVKVNKVSELEKIGFITETDLSRLNVSEKVAVYFPHAYAFSGELFIVPTDNITPIDVPAADVMKFIVSGGVSGWS
ncbi:MAG: DUF502 domain-containing protein [Salinivirgaceae bacterium]|nr:DUF502 domain-containing protein [Salinivirgaceae bacterium]